jgi:hypothetical protein
MHGQLDLGSDEAIDNPLVCVNNHMQIQVNLSYPHLFFGSRGHFLKIKNSYWTNMNGPRLSTNMALVQTLKAIFVEP